MCTAKSKGLVRYPTTLAPASGSVAVTAHCADNAIVTNSTSLHVRCGANGNWTGVAPVCHCHDGYREITRNGTKYCQGQQLKHPILIYFEEMIFKKLF